MTGTEPPCRSGAIYGTAWVWLFDDCLGALWVISCSRAPPKGATTPVPMDGDEERWVRNPSMILFQGSHWYRDEESWQRLCAHLVAGLRPNRKSNPALT